jgi:sodium-dependent dicarboxylate transporter 2/3/5
MPIALTLVYGFYRVLARSIPMDMEITDLKLHELEGNSGMHRKNRIAVLLTLFLTIGLWLTEPLHGIPVAATSAVPIVLLTLTQVIRAEQVRALPWDTLMLVAGGLALGLAIVEVGLSDIIMQQLAQLPVPAVGIAAIFAIISVLLSNFMSNTAASAILVPLGLTLTGIFGIATPLIIAVSCSCALLLPVSTPANAIAYATGLIEQKDFRKGGLFFLWAGPATAFAVIMLWAVVFG